MLGQQIGQPLTQGIHASGEVWLESAEREASEEDVVTI